ncbi:single-stranded DNA-binding protein [Conchiformibius kuhniae]|uniref:Single-stranded DNA-binding protein n=1 Tax=Conchiformibius kuhniae TaxID=211502 RepID=A0A8T9MYR3_9NEIS|nr:single-stranded DNA-binding protein [Conchiformibius kuhniae]UOP04973.1 single-stranded DNA-binding protein [Conchiformibius kuhniae]
MSLNKVMLIGRLGRDPEMRYMPSGDAVCNFSLATDESWNDKQSGQKVSKTEWHNITLFNKTAEIAGQYLKKGSQVYIEGRIQSRKYTGKDGVERTAYDIVGNQMQMLGSKNDNAPSAAPSYDSYTAAPPPQNNHHAAPAAASYQAPPPPQQQRPVADPPAPVEDIDDDIPF